MFLICAEFTDWCSSLSKEPLTMKFMGQWRLWVMAPALAAGASPPGIPYYRTHRALTHFSLGLQIEPSTFAKCLWLFFTPTIKKPLKLNLGIKFRVADCSIPPGKALTSISLCMRQSEVRAWEVFGGDSTMSMTSGLGGGVSVHVISGGEASCPAPLLLKLLISHWDVSATPSNASCPSWELS